MAYIYDGGINTDKISERTSGTGTDINGVVLKDNIVQYLNFVQNTKVNLSASLDPTSSDDSGQLYSPGSTWVNTNNDKAFICVDATAGMAIWKDITEVNTMSNIGTSGIGVFKQKTGADFELKKLNNLSNKISITDDTINNKIDFDIALNVIRVYSTSLTSTTSTGYIVVNSMSLTPGAGYYLVSFSAYSKLDNYSGVFAEYIIRSGTTYINHSKRLLYNFSHAQSLYSNVHTSTYIYVSSGQTIDVLYRTSVSGVPVYTLARILYLIKISN